MRARIAAIAVALFGLGVAAGTADAHPLGNFSVNHLTVVKISADRVDVRYVLDQAEIPTFRERGPERRRDPGAQAARGRRAAGADRRRPRGRAAPGRRAGAHPSRRAGRAADDAARAAAARGGRAGAKAVSVRDGTFAGRVGWVAVQALPGERTHVRTQAPATDPTGGLRRYPEDLLASPSHVRDADFAVRPGGGTLDAGTGRVSTAGGDARSEDGFAGLLVRRRRARPAAARRVRLGRAARALAGARQGDGRRLPRRHARQHPRRDRAGRDGHGDAHGGGDRARRGRARPLRLDPARGPVPVAHAGVRAARRERRRGRPARPRARVGPRTRAFARPRSRSRPPAPSRPRGRAGAAAEPARDGRVGRADPVPVGAGRPARRGRAASDRARARPHRRVLRRPRGDADRARHRGRPRRPGARAPAGPRSARGRRAGGLGGADRGRRARR